MTYDVAALYRFVDIADVPALCAELRAIGLAHDICGSLLIAPEGINGTIAAPPGRMADMMAHLDRLVGIQQGEVKYSTSADKPFLRFKVRPKKEIVTLRQPQANPAKRVGQYVAPKDWNDLIADPDVVVIDTRNRYETKIGMFEGAIDPDTEIFTEFTDFVRNRLDARKHMKIAMYCTGGIRCEKASSFMLAEGFEQVYHLKGGILKYLEDVPPEQSKWRGDCFVFDRRTALSHGLQESALGRCWGCGYPLTDTDMASSDYEEGVSCSHCIDTLTEAQKEGFRERHRQMTARGAA